MTPKPLRMTTWLLERFAVGPRRDSIIGDIVEQYWLGRSAVWYRRQVIAVVAIGMLARMRSQARRLIASGVLVAIALISFKAFVLTYCVAGLAALLMTITSREEPGLLRSALRVGVLMR